MSPWLLVGGAAILAIIILRKRPGAAPPPSVVPGPAASVPDADETAIAMKAKIRELEILADIQAKINLQTKFDRISRANKAANPDESPPKS